LTCGPYSDDEAEAAVDNLVAASCIVVADDPIAMNGRDGELSL
jgi:hypothetical protein